MRKKRMIVLTGIAAVGLAVFSAFIAKTQSNSWYKPTTHKTIISGEEDDETQGAMGAAEWWFGRTRDPLTGQVDMDEVMRVQNLAKQSIANASTQRNSSVTSVASVSWNEIGPDNVGGRTRAILFDNQDATHLHMFAGSVSGGLWESNDGALNWHRCAGFFNVAGVVNTVVTIAQATNGDLYVGTGEGGFYYLLGIGSGAFTGDGIYKSTDDGATWTVLPSTQPTNQNSVSSAWISVNKIACDPADAQHVYAGTNKGFKESHDGGLTWTTPNGITSASSSCLDVQVSGSHVIAIITGKPWLSVDNGASFISVGNAANGFAATNIGRTTVAISPSDPNYVYLFVAKSGATNPMLGVWASVDGGNNWTQVCGAGNAQFDPFGGNGQGTYDNIVSVDPTNPQRAVFGGTALYEWDMISTNPIAGQWTQIATEFPASLFNPYYVHSDKHAIVWHPTLQGVFYVGCDGGVFKSHPASNGTLTYSAMNAGYNVTQCYSVAIENTAPLRNQAMAGCQDNGTNFVDGTGNTSMSSIATGGGDGAQCDISFLNPLGTFQTVYYGALSRSNNRGVSAANFYDARITALMATAGFSASFVTPIRLWESYDDTLTGDSIVFINDTLVQNKDVTNGDSASFHGNLSVPTPVASPAATLLLNTVKLVIGTDTLKSNASGVFSGPGVGTINGTTGHYDVTFNTVPAANNVLKAIFNVSYGAGTVFTLNSNVQGKTISYTTPTQINPDDVMKVQDPIQSHIAVGFTGDNGVWMCRRAIDFASTPPWIKIAGAHSLPDAFSGEADVLTWSPNGNDLYVGIGGQSPNGNVYRISNLGAVLDSANGDVDAGTVANPTSIVTCTRIANFSGRAITGIDVDPHNPDHVLVSLGNYQANTTPYVYECTNATTAPSSFNTSNFVNKTGVGNSGLYALGAVPVYACTYDKYVANRVLVGTEHGMFETMNFNAANPTWTPAMTGLDNVPVDQIRQQRWEAWQVPNSGCFYIGTHGRGMWRDDSSWQQPTGISNPSNPYSESSNSANHDLKVFPNPVVDNSHVTFNLSKQGDATVLIYDLSGKVVFSKKYEQLIAGTNTVEFETNEMVKGTYIITVMQDAKRIGSGRFIKMN